MKDTLFLASGDCSASKLKENGNIEANSINFISKLTFVSKHRPIVCFVLQIDRMLLSMFCMLFVTLWKSSFPRNPPTPWKLLPFNPPPNCLPWWGHGYFLEPHKETYEHGRSFVRQGLRFINCSPYTKRLENLTICGCNYKGSTFCSVV